MPDERMTARIERVPLGRRQQVAMRSTVSAVTRIRARSAQRPASSCSRNLSASSAAMQPVPAEVTAWR